MRMEDKMNTVIAREKKKIREQDGSTLVYIYIYIYIYTLIMLNIGPKMSDI